MRLSFFKRAAFCLLTISSLAFPGSTALRGAVGADAAPKKRCPSYSGTPFTFTCSFLSGLFSIGSMVITLLNRDRCLNDHSAACWEIYKQHVRLSVGSQVAVICLVVLGTANYCRFQPRHDLAPASIPPMDLQPAEQQPEINDTSTPLSSPSSSYLSSPRLSLPHHSPTASELKEAPSSEVVITFPRALLAPPPTTLLSTETERQLQAPQGDCLV